MKKMLIQKLKPTVKY